MGTITSYKEELEYSGLILPFSIDLKEDRPLGKVVDYHWHDWYQVIYMIKGSATVAIGHEEYPLGPDGLVIVNQGDVHAFSINEKTPASYMVLMFHPDIVKSMGMSVVESKYMMSFFNDLKSSVYTVSNKVEANIKLKSIFYQMHEEYTKKESGYELVIKGYMYHFIAMLMRSGFFKEGVYNSSELERLTALFDYIKTHYKEELSMQDLADYLNVSYSYFSKYFKKTTGKTFKQYLDYLRVSEAEKLMLSGGYNVTEAAIEVGFKDVSSFNRVFKRIKSYSPKEAKTKSVKK